VLLAASHTVNVHRDLSAQHRTDPIRRLCCRLLCGCSG